MDYNNKNNNFTVTNIHHVYIYMETRNVMEKVTEGQDQLVIMPYMDTCTNTDSTGYN